MLFMSKFQVIRTLPVLQPPQPNHVDWWVASARASLRLSSEGTFHHYFTQLVSEDLRRAGEWAAVFQARALHHSHLYILHHPTGSIFGSAPTTPLLSKLTAHIQQYQVAWPHSVCDAVMSVLLNVPYNFFIDQSENGPYFYFDLNCFEIKVRLLSLTWWVMLTTVLQGPHILTPTAEIFRFQSSTVRTTESESQIKLEV